MRKADGRGVALDRACAALAAKQGNDGAWTVDCDMGPVSTAQVVAALQFVGKLEAPEAAAACRYLESHWLGPGRGFGAHPGAQETDLDTTATVLAGLRAAGLHAEHPIVDDATRVIERMGGMGALGKRLASGDLAALFLATVGMFPPEDLPTAPAAFAVPGAELVLESRLNVSIPFRLLATEPIIRYLRSDGHRSPGSRVRSGQAAFSSRSVFDRMLGVGRNLVGRQVWDLARAIDGQRCLAYFARFQNDDGSWLYGDTLHASLVLMAMSALDIPQSDHRFQATLAFIDSRKRTSLKNRRALTWYSIFGAEVWATAFATRSLLYANRPASAAVTSRGVTWLLDAERRGAWGFQRGNSSMPDCDCVAVVLATLAAANGPDLARVQAAISRGRAWLLKRQNPEGGWAAYQHGLRGKPPGPIMTRDWEVLADDVFSYLRLFREPPPELTDPATEDLTGRVLFGLGRTGSRAADEPIARALAFLRGMQDTNGGWWGRWTVNYLASTAWVLRGMAAVGADLSADWVQPGVRFLIAHQNTDGGWGEEVASYRDPDRVGRGPSTTGLTGLVLLALLESGLIEGQSVQRAEAFLLRRRRSDGTWPADGELHALLPPRLFYVLPENQNQLAVEALAAAEAPTVSRVSPVCETVEPISEEHLRLMGDEGDPIADNTIAAVFAEHAVDAVNELMHLLVRADLPVPEQLPVPCRQFFLDHGSLPPWADWRRIGLAEDLFFRSGFGVATSLFCSSLPQCFAFPDGAAVLTSTAGFKEAAHRRVVETAQFVFHVASRGGLAREGRGIRAAQKVRLIHAAVRFLIGQRGGWSRQALGTPISQRQLVGTMLAFSVVVTDGLRRLGFQVGDAEVEAWYHLWRVVGSLLGISERWLPASATEGARWMQQLRVLYWGPSRSGAALTDATLALMREWLPHRGLDRAPVSLVRHLAGDRCADLLGLPRSDWTAIAVSRAARVFGVTAARLFAREGAPAAGAELTQRLLFSAMEALTTANLKGHEVRFGLPIVLGGQRQHKRPPVGEA